MDKVNPPRDITLGDLRKITGPDYPFTPEKPLNRRNIVITGPNFILERSGGKVRYLTDISDKMGPEEETNIDSVAYRISVSVLRDTVPELESSDPFHVEQIPQTLWTFESNVRSPFIRDYTGKSEWFQKI